MAPVTRLGQKRQHRAAATANFLAHRRPKMPATGYILFIKQFAHDQKKRMSGVKLIRRAAKIWKTLPKPKKDEWNKFAENRRTLDRYQERLAQYKMERQLLKQAPKPYALFVHFYWNQIPRNGLEFGIMSQHCAKSWNAFNAEDKLRYQNKYIELAVAHAQMMESLNNGGRIEDFLPGATGTEDAGGLVQWFEGK